MNDHRNDITLGLIVQGVRKHTKQLGVYIAVVVAVTACVMFSIPDYYRSDEIVGYEEETSTVAEGLHAVGLSLGYNIGHVKKNTDAIFPPHYTYLMKSKRFMARVMQIEVTLQNGEQMSYFDYLCRYPQQSWWTSLSSGRFFSPQQQESSIVIDPTHLTDYQLRVFDEASKRILCSANTNKNEVTFSVIDRNAVICALMADSIRQLVQSYMESYRRQKFQERVTFLEAQASYAQSAYQQSVKKYNDYVDAHQGTLRGSFYAHANRLKLEMMQHETVWSAAKVQRDLERDRLEDRTSVFTMIQRAAVPLEADGPPRLFGIALAFFLTFLLSMLYFIKDSLFHQFR